MMSRLRPIKPIKTARMRKVRVYTKKKILFKKTKSNFSKNICNENILINGLLLRLAYFSGNIHFVD